MRTQKRKATRTHPQQRVSIEVEYVRKKQRRGGHWIEPVASKITSQPPSPHKEGSSGATSLPMTPLQNDDWVNDNDMDPFMSTPGSTLGKVMNPSCYLNQILIAFLSLVTIFLMSGFPTGSNICQQYSPMSLCGPPSASRVITEMPCIDVSIALALPTSVMTVSLCHIAIHLSMTLRSGMENSFNLSILWDLA
jgi:hypothetical protein